MKCLVFSDSHGSSLLMKRALGMHPDAEVVFFLGDGLYEAQELSKEYKGIFWVFVRGNCDTGASFYMNDVKKCETVRLMGYTVTATHGDLYGAKYGSGGLIRLAEESGSDIILYGHTHLPRCETVAREENNIYLFNPGSISVSSGSYGVLILDKYPLFSHGTLRQY